MFADAGLCRANRAEIVRSIAATGTCRPFARDIASPAETELEDVSMGGSQELKASSVVLNFNFSALLSEIKDSQFEINDLILNAEPFDKALLATDSRRGHSCSSAWCCSVYVSVTMDLVCRLCGGFDGQTFRQGDIEKRGWQN